MNAEFSSKLIHIIKFSLKFIFITRKKINSNASKWLNDMK